MTPDFRKQTFGWILQRTQEYCRGFWKCMSLKKPVSQCCIHAKNKITDMWPWTLISGILLVVPNGPLLIFFRHLGGHCWSVCFLLKPVGLHAVWSYFKGSIQRNSSLFPHFTNGPFPSFKNPTVFHPSESERFKHTFQSGMVLKTILCSK